MVYVAFFGIQHTIVLRKHYSMSSPVHASSTLVVNSWMITPLIDRFDVYVMPQARLTPTRRVWTYTHPKTLRIGMYYYLWSLCLLCIYVSVCSYLISYFFVRNEKDLVVCVSKSKWWSSSENSFHPVIPPLYLVFVSILL